MNKNQFSTLISFLIKKREIKIRAKKRLNERRKKAEELKEKNEK